MTIRRLRARLERLAPPAAPTIGEDPARDRQRHGLLYYRKITKGQILTPQEEAELLALTALFEEKDRRRIRFAELDNKSSRTESEQQELEDLKRRFPQDIIDPLESAIKAWGESARQSDLEQAAVRQARIAKQQSRSQV